MKPPLGRVGLRLSFGVTMRSRATRVARYTALNLRAAPPLCRSLSAVHPARRYLSIIQHTEFAAEAHASRTSIAKADTQAASESCEQGRKWIVPGKPSSRLAPLD